MTSFFSDTVEPRNVQAEDTAVASFNFFDDCPILAHESQHARSNGGNLCIESATIQERHIQIADSAGMPFESLKHILENSSSECTF